MRRKLTAHLRHQLQKAPASALHLLYINTLLRILVPFNAPHGFALAAYSPERVEVRLPFCRANKNHLGGIHACAIATAAEMSSGLLLLQEIDLSEYRLIMKEMTVTYEKQGRSNLMARCSSDSEDSKQKRQDELNRFEACSVKLVSEVFEELGERIAFAEITWQMKTWRAVHSTLREKS